MASAVGWRTTGSMSSQPTDVIRRLDKSQKKANMANEERYQNLLKSIQGTGEQTQATFGEALTGVADVGSASRERIRRNYANLWGQAEQDLISRGLGNTTIRPTVRRGIASDEALALSQVDESMAQLRSGILQNRAGMEFNVGGLQAGAIQNRSDVGPDLSLYAGLLQQSAASQVPGQGGTPPLYSFVPTNPQSTGSLSQNLRAKFGTQTGQSGAGADGTPNGGAAGGAPGGNGANGGAAGAGGGGGGGNDLFLNPYLLQQMAAGGSVFLGGKGSVTPTPPEAPASAVSPPSTQNTGSGKEQTVRVTRRSVSALSGPDSKAEIPMSQLPLYLKYGWTVLN